MKLLSSYWPAVHFIGFLLVWAGPMLYYGLTDRPASWLAPEWRIFYRIAALFTDRTPDWYDRHIQVRTATSSQCKIGVMVGILTDLNRFLAR
jgi:hypothetical protein